MFFKKKEVLGRWAEYVGELFEDKKPPLPQPSNNNGPSILKSEVELAMKNSPEGKAPGEDGINTEMLKHLDQFGIDTMTELFNDIYDSGHIPEELLQSVFITIPKKQKATKCEDFRTISLMPHIMKIFLKIILERIKGKINKEIGEEQFGFRSGSGTREGIFCMNIIAQKNIQIQNDLFACFIDYSKAFDRIHHLRLIECLEKIGIDGKDIRIIGNLYWQQKATIKVGNELSDYTEIRRGVKQGCVLSPYLFNIYTEFIFRETQNLQGVTIGGHNINNLRYADDTVLLANTNGNLSEMVTAVKMNSSKAGLDMNTKKTKTMVLSKSSGKTTNITIDGERIEQVHRFKYLGATITDDGRSEKEINIRTANAKARFSQMYKLFKSRQLSLTLRKKMLECYIFPIFLYGAETWTLTKKDENKINAFEMWCYRRMARISWKAKKTNNEVCQILHTRQTLLNNIKRRKMQYYGHVRRHETIMKKVLEGKMCGRRARGRQRTTWMDNIREWTGLDMAECATAARDRARWRVITRQPLRQR